AAARLAAALLAFALLAPAPARAQALGTLRVDDVRVRRDGRHRLVVSVLDPGGTPVSSLEHAFHVDLDGQPVSELVAQATRRRYPTGTLTVVVDGQLLQSGTLAGVQDAVQALARSLEPGDRLRVVSAGGHVRSHEAGAGGGAELADALAHMADDDTPDLYDVLFDAVHRTQRLPGDRGGLVLLVTRGADGGSRHKLLDVVAVARGNDRLVPVLVALIGDQGPAGEADRLQRLTEHTGGSFTRAASAADLATTLPAQLDRGLHRWVLTFPAPGWDRTRPQHRLGVQVAVGAERREQDLAYDTADVLAPPWWRSPLPWLLVGLLLAAALALPLARRRRQLCLLVHDGDEDDGVWYEVFSLPLTLGGAAGNDVVFADGQVSRNHAVLERRGRIVELADLNSENGTFVNGERISRRVLADGDRISLGPAVHLVYEARS
ncbi:MAG TPA: FHA domain-containing protein, partial [Candidatus Eisenbacteria bacterium]|nr:FHA domain-containing protein [Candidatus Eisenbacteria bacterium]